MCLHMNGELLAELSRMGTQCHHSRTQLEGMTDKISHGRPYLPMGRFMMKCKCTLRTYIRTVVAGCKESPDASGSHLHQGPTNMSTLETVERRRANRRGRRHAGRVFSIEASLNLGATAKVSAIRCLMKS